MGDAGSSLTNKSMDEVITAIKKLAVGENTVVACVQLVYGIKTRMRRYATLVLTYEVKPASVNSSSNPLAAIEMLTTSRTSSVTL